MRRDSLVDVLNENLTSQGLYENAVTDIEIADLLCVTYRRLSYRRYKNAAAYHLQQAIEKLIKVQIRIVIAGDYSTEVKLRISKGYYTHDIGNLLRLCKSVGILSKMYIPSDVILFADKLSEWEADVRYNKVKGIATSFAVAVLKKFKKDLKGLEGISRWR